MKPRILRLCQSILSRPTAPGFEDLTAEAVRAELRSVRARVKTDRGGNFFARVGRGRPAFIFCSHLDHPGFALRRRSGRAWEAEFLGGLGREWFRAGTRIVFFEPDGSIAGRGAILETRGTWPRDKRVRVRPLSGELRRGLFGMWDLPAMRQSGARIHSRACDDLIGCVAIVGALQELAKRGLPGAALLTRREEIGLCGAFEVARSRLLPANVPVISIETSKELCNARQGDGPIVRVGDRSSIFSPEITGRLCAKARILSNDRAGFRWQRRLMDGGTCEATAFYEKGRPASGLCIALGNYHNAGSNGRVRAENVHLQDLLDLVELLIALGR
ncbi:MAG: hypothetical protein JO317_03965 [Verrucomicrobiae bacterium]|nr:hypothetical protein [Verrucomicrobiae bacterium]